MSDWLTSARSKIERMPEGARQIREAALEDLFFFAQLVNPLRVYGDIHKEIFKWLQDDASGNQLLLLPRAHMKSHAVAMWCAWYITKYPETTILYISATAELAEKQLYDIKNVMTSDVYTRYFPDMINPEEGKREKWSVSKIAVDHPSRKKEGIRDWTVATAGLTTNTTGWHSDIIVADDVVVPDNAYTDEGRRRVSSAMSQMTSIRNAGGFTKACGTRYHPADIYDSWKKQTMFVFNEETQEVVDRVPIWDIKEYPVEVDGMFLWPREMREDGKSFGFNLNVLSRIKGEYEDIVQFFAQYYNNPNNPGSERISRDKFQYYDPRFLKEMGGYWFFKERKLNVYASIDFAFSLKKAADYTAIVVIGVDHEGHIYILDIERFRGDRTKDYFEKIARLHSKWDFRKLRAEVSVAQSVIVNDLKDMIKKEGMTISIDPHRPQKEGSKGERIAASLETKYENQTIWHFKGGYTQILEEELVLARPPHDDIKDALSGAVSIAIKPKTPKGSMGLDLTPAIRSHRRFGGVAFK